ncbi:MAG: Mur ligase family protein [Bdellovibrionota bacterium]
MSPKTTLLGGVKRIHIIGIGGTLMGAFAAYLKRQGLFVTGSDQNVYPPMSDVLKEAGIELFHGYAADNILGQTTRPDLVVVGNVVQSTNQEVRAAVDGGYGCCSLPEAMELFFLEDTHNIVVAGTHGKTTTSSMIAHVLTSFGKRPSYFIGGVSNDLPFGFNVSDNSHMGGYFVLEGDEYDTSFWDKGPKFNHYLPNDVLLTSVEFDHADIFADLEAVKCAFRMLLTKIRGGRLVACHDYPAVRELVSGSTVDLITYGTEESSSARFKIANLRTENDKSVFDVIDSGKKVEQIKLCIAGRHNAANALASWIECTELGLDSARVVSALGEFSGVKRRQEVKAVVKGITVIDDFAHHPTAVRETLAALRQRYASARIIAVFEPRSATSRRKIFQQEYVKAFLSADAVFVSSPYDQSKIPDAERFSSRQLVENLVARGKQAASFQQVNDGVREVSNLARSGDVIVVLSNGGFGGFIEKIISKF